jgi:transposase
VYQGTVSGRIIWNPTFRAFAEYWAFEPRLCQPYRAQNKGKVESRIKYFKHPLAASERDLSQVSSTDERMSLPQDAIHEYVGLVFYRVRGWIWPVGA